MQGFSQKPDHLSLIFVQLERKTATSDLSQSGSCVSSEKVCEKLDYKRLFWEDELQGLLASCQYPTVARPRR